MPRSVIFVIPIFLLALAPRALACGGYEVTPIEQMLEFSELVVSGRIVFVDDIGVNFILQVDRYFKGGGGNYLPIVNTRPAFFYADTARDYEHGCGNLGYWGHKVRKDQQGYFALQARADGTYSYYPESVWIPGDLHSYRRLESPDDYVEFNTSYHSDYDFETPALVNRFEEILLLLSDSMQAAPPAGDHYPLMRFLKITTESGNRYRLNPDRSVTWLDPAAWPIAISNDGSHVMFRVAEDELAFQYLDLERKELLRHPDCERFGCNAVNEDSALPIRGWHARFSPDSNFVAVQERDELLIYMFDNWTMEEYYYGRLMSMEVVAGQRVQWEPYNGEEPMAWSADSTTIAYQDSRGIWHWDIFEHPHPQLVLEDIRDVTLLDISRSGRFIRYSHDGTWSLLDTNTGETREGAVATPDESSRIVFRFGKPFYMVDGFSGKRYAFNGYSRRKCMAPLLNCPVLIETPYVPFEFFEFQPGWIGLVARGGVQVYPWHLSMDEGYMSIMVETPTSILAFDYDEMYKLPATAYGDFTIAFGFTTDLKKGPNEDGFYKPINLRLVLDSPIVDIEWGQPVFYLRQ